MTRRQPGRSDRASNWETPERLWEALRQGARNVAGVTFQIAVTADLLVAGRTAQVGLPDVSQVIPEGFEDIDCVLSTGQRLMVQVKERGLHGRHLGAADVATAMVHAAPALRIADGLLDPKARFALVTDGQLIASGIGETGWRHSLAASLRESGDDGHATLRNLTEEVTSRLIDNNLPPELAEPLLAATSVIRRPWHLRLETERMMRDRLGLHPSVANLAYADLVVDLTQVAADQRDRGRREAGVRTVGDLDTLIRRLQETVDLEALDEAVRDGVVEPVDYLHRSQMSQADFLAGVDVSPAHVAAGLDAPRVEELSLVLDGLDVNGHVVVAGPSGSGKSALMWRAARDVGRGARPVRVLRCASASDVTLLVRHARLQRASPQAPLLVCVDDLGRDTLTHWPAARDQLLAAPGVFVLCTVRREDFTARQAGNTTVVDPRLNNLSARSVYSLLEEADVPLAMEPEEAIERADGLLMEFITLATTGHRLASVLAAQVEALAQPTRRLQRRALRLVTVAHTLGSAISAEALGTHLAADGKATVEDVGDALGVLADEHLLRAQADGMWRGLHDLRTEVLVGLLHASPPPTLATSFAEVLPLLPGGRRGYAMRRAAEKLCVAAGTALDSRDPHASFSRLSDLARPLAEAAASIMSSLTQDADSARQTADLLDGALRADAAIYAATCLPFLDASRPPGVDLHSLDFIAFSVRNNGVRMPDQLESGRRLNSLALQLPERLSPLHAATGSGVTGARLVSLAKALSLPDAIELLEAAEGAINLTGNQAATVWSHHVPVLADPPGVEFDQPAADQRAQLAATLAELAGLRGEEVAAALGPVEARATDAVASDPHGLTVTISLLDHRPEDDPDSALLRPETFAPGKLLVGQVRQLAQWSGPPPASAYPPLPQEKGDGSVHDQSLCSARRLTDSCPELDRVDVDVLQANLRPMRITTELGSHDEGVKSLRRGTLRRRSQTRGAVAHQAAVARLIAAGSWSERLRLQAAVAAKLSKLLTDLPEQLRTHCSDGRRRAYLKRAEEATAEVSRLPRRPRDSQKEELWTGVVAPGRLDERDRANDLAQSALSSLAQAVVQVARGLAQHDAAAVNAAAYQLADLPGEFAKARMEGAPTYAGIGDTLPSELDTLAALATDLLLARQIAPASQALLDRSSGTDYPQLAQEVVRLAATDQEETDRGTVISWVADRHIPATDYVIPDDDPPVGRLGPTQVLVVVPVDDWQETVRHVQQWPSAQREDLTGGAVFVAAEQERILPIGLSVRGGLGTALPLVDRTVFKLAAAVTGLALAESTPVTEVVQTTVNSLLDASHERVRDAHRDNAWARPGRYAPDPGEIADDLRERYAPHLVACEQGEEDITGMAVSVLLDLCAAVDGEDGSNDGFAAAMASLDPARLQATTSPLVELVDAAAALGLYAQFP